MENAVAHILVADDDEILCEMLKFRLENEGYGVTVVTDGLAALSKLEEGDIDLVILDFMMPIVAGPEVLARMKGSDDLAEIPVIMLTARRAESDVVSLLKSGVDEYVIKPFIPAELLVRIEKQLR